MKVIQSIVIISVLLSCCASAALGNELATTGASVDAQRFHWKNKVIKVTVSNTLLNQNSNVKTGSDVVEAISRSLLAWQKVADIEFQIDTSDKQSVSPSGIAGDGVSLITIAQTPENLLFFLKDAETASAKTRIFYNGRGFITEADIVLNPYQQFSTDGTFGTYDLESTLTHEVGHLLGLRHSSVLGATMLDNFGKVGVFGVSDFSPRSLSESDIASIRELYGPNTEAEDCCSRISGRITAESGKVMKNLRVWAEEVETGRVVAQVETAIDGSYRIGGLRAGNYALFCKTKDASSASAMSNLGVVSVEKAEKKVVNLKAALESSEVAIRHIGINGRLADFAVPLVSGSSFMVYLGGRNLNSKNVTIDIHSPFLEVSRRSIVNLDYGDDISVISFEVNVDPKAPAGDYSVFVTSKDGSEDCLVGALTVDEARNP